jgi:anaerobic magnesium-protoporphyrin IX monomethyl ester cyclase
VRILAFQFVPDVRGRPVPRFDPQLGTLLALLERRGHHLSLAGLARFDMTKVKAALARALPQLVYADISAVCVDAARRTLEYLERHEFVPVVAGGQYPTLDPAAALSLPAVRAVAVGEPDASLATYLERRKDPAAGQVVSGVWLRDERGLARPEVPDLVEDLNSLPFAHREAFDYGEIVRQTGQVEIAIGRGCPQRCTYCLNDRIAALYEGRGTWVRRRAPGNILAEIALLREHFAGVERVRFLDHTFAQDAEWLGEFLAAYQQRCGLPFRCHLRANAADEETVQLLAAAGGELVDVEVISGSDFIRNEIFEMDLSGEQIRATFERLRSAGIRSRAIVYLGAPYESEASLADTRALLLEIKPDLADVRPYHPWPGTRAWALCREQGWLHPRGEEQYHDDRTGLDMPACRPELVVGFIRRLRPELPTTIGEPWWRRWSVASRNALGQVFQRRRL